MIQHIQNFFRRAHADLRQSQQIYMVLIALVIGLGGGLFAVAFRKLIGLGNQIGWFESEYTLELIRRIPFWWKIIVPAVGGLLCGLIIHYFAREAKGHGVPEVIEAVALKGGRIRPRVVVAKMFASAISIASGGSVGREGPIVQIGSALGSTLGQWLRIDERQLRTLVGCGAAAGIAATFNAPVAGALFAAEIILGDFGVRYFSPIVISSVSATVVGHYFLGDVPAFVVPTYSVVHYGELFAYALLGLLAGLTALAFIRILYAGEDLFDIIPIPGPVKAMIGGAIIGVIALKFPQIYGVGYEAIEQALRGELIWQILLVLVAVKILAVSITIGSGGSGGIFAPSLFIGAMLGGAVGTVVHTLWPDSTAEPGAYALVGMGAVVAAGTHAPITAILIIFELTADYKIIMPLMISCIIGTLLTTRLQSASIYTLKLLRRGVDVHKGRAVSVLRHVFVRDVMRADVVTVRAGEPLMPVISKFADHPGISIFVVADDRRLIGVITANQIRSIVSQPSAYAELIIAEDMMDERGFPTVALTDTLTDVMKGLERYRGEVPVVENGRVVGAIWPEDVVERYNAEVFKREMAVSMAAAVSSGAEIESIPAAKDSSLVEMPVPAEFVGRSLGQLEVRNRYGLTVLLVKQKLASGEEALQAAPDADYVFRAGDEIVVMGPNDRLRAAQRRWGAAGF